MAAHIVKVTVSPESDRAEFEKRLKEALLHTEVLHRNVQASSARLFKTGGDQYTIIFFVQLVSSIFETSDGQRPDVICEFALPVEELSKRLEGKASLEVIDEI